VNVLFAVRGAVQWAAALVVRPGRAFQAFDLPRALWLLALLLLTETLVIAAVVVSEPHYISASVIAVEMKRGLDHEAAAVEATRRIRALGRAAAINQVREALVDTAQLTVLWGVIGLWLSPVANRLLLFRSTLVVFIAAQISSTALFVVRYLEPVFLNTDLGPITVGATLSALGFTPWAPLHNLSLSSFWWVLIAGSGLAVLWRRPRLAVIGLLGFCTAIWRLVPVHLHQ